MTIPIQYTNIPAVKLTEGFSRYRNQKVIYWGDNKLLTFDTYLRQPYTRTGKEKVMLITKGVEYRPDLVSFDVYGACDFWWKIMEVNGMYDIFDFKAGTTIILPANNQLM